MMRRNRPITERMVRAALLDSAVYEEVERDTGATGQAAMVVLIAAVAAGIGALLGGSVIGLVTSIVGGIVGWIVWSFLTYWIGTTIFATPQTRTSPGEMLRTIGFSHTPGILRILGFIPILGPLILFATAVWQLVAGVIAVRQAMDFDTLRAIGTVVVGWVIVFVVQLILVLLLVG
jgi:hypothetical protein